MTIFWAFLAGILAVLPVGVGAETPNPSTQLIVRFNDGASPAAVLSQLSTAGMTDPLGRPMALELERVLVPDLNIHLVRVNGGGSPMQAAGWLSKQPQVRYAQADHAVELREKRPNDADFSKQWNMVGSSPGGTAKGHVSATQAWDLGTGGKDRGGSDVVVAVVDGGMDVTQEDLTDNVWRNPGEIPGNGVDDDGDGYIDDVYGWNVTGNNGTVPSRAHGTHVAGIIGARGNNAKGVAGINWNVKVMGISASLGQTSEVLAAYGFALKQKKLWLESHGRKGANVVATNSSFGIDRANCNAGEYPAWNDIYDELGKAGILSAAATTNIDNLDVDQAGDVPTGCSSEYLIKVTNTDATDGQHGGYGARSIDLGAPGTQVFSTVPGNRVEAMSGTSMATPHVAGAVAFLHSVAGQGFYDRSRADPASAALELKQNLVSSVDPIPSLRGKTTSGGRLNLRRAAERMQD